MKALRMLKIQHKRTKPCTPKTNGKAVRFVQKDVPLWEVAGFCGATVETIERTYGHQSPDELRNIAAALSRGTS
ncbi:MAG: hypothetical protein A2018_02060 [Alphaproteobacteria bacterium GWF2_58_20]|nr:MAG: hypothetical protein A2018_02060 [Alphaproteobacteria bacterium GWF2_58_20]